MRIGVKVTTLRDRIISRTPALATLRRTTGKASRVVTATDSTAKITLNRSYSLACRDESRGISFKDVILCCLRSNRLVPARVAHVELASRRTLLGRRHQDWEQGGNRHDSRDHMKRAAIGSRCLSHVGDQQRPDCAGNTPSGQHQTIDWTYVLRAKIVRGKRRHSPKSTSIAHQYNEGENSHQRDSSGVR